MKKPKTLKQLQDMSDVEIVDYSLQMVEKDLNKAGSRESEYVLERMTKSVEER